MTLYDHDFYQWTQEQAALLKAGALARLDVENLIEEVEAMGKTQKRELYSRLAVLIMHMLKWDYQENERSGSWRNTILTQRREIKFLLRDNPSLNRFSDEAVSIVYGDAVEAATEETGLPAATFPAECPYSIDAIMNTPYHQQGATWG